MSHLRGRLKRLHEAGAAAFKGLQGPLQLLFVRLEVLKVLWVPLCLGLLLQALVGVQWDRRGTGGAPRQEVQS